MHSIDCIVARVQGGCEVMSNTTVYWANQGNRFVSSFDVYTRTNTLK